MMFCMGRLDILPVGDLGIKNGIMRLYRLPVIPTPGQMLSIAVQGSWTPYQSVAAWYIWQSLDNAPK
jgi:DNA-3-methyladenine glycosylase II